MINKLKGTIKRGKVLEKALNVINGERQDNYGKPEDSFQIIADFWAVYEKYRKPGTERPMDVAIKMVLFKIARMLGQQDTMDNYVDAAGYIAIAGDMLEKGTKEKS